VLLLCNLFQSWWAKILLVNIGYCLNIKKSFLHVQNHNHIFWTNCQEQEVESQCYMRFRLLNNALKNLFWLYDVLTQCAQLFTVCVLSRSHFQQIWSYKVLSRQQCYAVYISLLTEHGLITFNMVDNIKYGW